MKHLKTFFLAALGLFMFCTSALADNKFLLSGGDRSVGSTYDSVATQLMDKCRQIFSSGADVKTSSGGLANRDALRLGEVDSAMMPIDLLYALRMSNAAAVKDIKLLVYLYPEMLHFMGPPAIDRSSDMEKFKNKIGMGELKITRISDISGLSGLRVGAVGASAITAKIVSGISGLNYTVVEYGNAKEMMAGHAAGQHDAVLLIGGYPYRAVDGMPQGWTILSIPKAISDKLAASKLYAPSMVSYASRGADRETVSVMSAIFVRQPRSNDRKQELTKFRECFFDSVSKYADARGVHPVWREMLDAKDQAALTSWDLVNLQPK